MRPCSRIPIPLCTPLAALLAAAALAPLGCGPAQHCQSGPKYGTQCYDNQGRGRSAPQQNPDPPPANTNPMPAR
jgi:hypothetical protein